MSNGTEQGTAWTILTRETMALVELANAAGLRIQCTPGGALFAIRDDRILINQVMPGPVENGMMRLYLRDRDAGTGRPVTGMAPGLLFGQASAHVVTWSGADDGLTYDTTLALHPDRPLWSWSTRVTNTGAAPRTLDLLYGQDLGLNHENGVRECELYTSQYIDHLPVHDPAYGPVILSRHTSGGAWLAQGCLHGAAGYATDGHQFFGAAFRATDRPAALDQAGLPSTVLQYECAYIGVQSHPFTLNPGESREITFFAVWQRHHPSRSSDADLADVRQMLDGVTPRVCPADAPVATRQTCCTTPLLHGDELDEGAWASLFPGAHRHVERDGAGHRLSFFHGDHRHVTSRRKEAGVERPSGHVIRGGRSLWLDGDAVGTTVYAPGIFGGQVYIGNPCHMRLLSPTRNYLNLLRSTGQRVFVHHDGAWRQLGTPSAFEMGLQHARWLYRLGATLLEVTAWSSDASALIFLDLRILEGEPRAFRVSHHLGLGQYEMDTAGEARVHPEAWVAVRPDQDSRMEALWPGTCFAIVPTDPAAVARIGGDELLDGDTRPGQGAYVVVEWHPTGAATIALTGTHRGGDALPPLVAAARRHPPFAPCAEAFVGALTGGLTLRHADEPGASRLSEIVPWFAHHAWIHFTMPHGLEQNNGGAWGTRDVTQGAIEWLLAVGQYAAARRALLLIFERQFPRDGSFPQWYHLPPLHHLQGAHPHGDVIFWPIKALADYIEATDDTAFLDEVVAYSDPETFALTDTRETIAQHIERFLRNYKARCIPGTALVNYDMGDWDDTLQPVDLTLRDTMVSTWTVQLAYHGFRQYEAVCRRAGRAEMAARMAAYQRRIRDDVNRLLILDHVVTAFAVFTPDGVRPMVHPRDAATGIRYRLLPMTRGVLSELFTPEQARHHLAIVQREMLFPDGAHLTSEPLPYHGGEAHTFRRGESAAFWGREIGTMYVHAHIRYAEAMARVGDADALWRALRVVNPVGLAELVPQAMPRQANVYFSSSDAAFPTRYAAVARFDDLRAGTVPVHGGWRVHSSGPGLFLNKLITQCLGIRESFGRLIIDPVLPRELDGLTARLGWRGRRVHWRYNIKDNGYHPTRLRVNGAPVPITTYDTNPYRDGGAALDIAAFAERLRDGENMAEVWL